MQITFSPSFQARFPRREVLQNYIKNNVPITEIAKRENYSVGYISKRCKEEGLKPINKHTIKKRVLVEKVKSMLLESLRVKFIADFLNCSEDTVYRIKSELKLKKTNSLYQKVKYMIEEGYSSREIRTALNLSEKDLSNIISNNKFISPSKLKREKIIELFECGFSDEEIANKFNDSIVAIQTRRRRYNLIKKA